MTNPNIGYVKLYRPGRVTIILAFGLFAVMFFSTVYLLSKDTIEAILFVAMFILSPIVLLIVDSFTRRRVLPRGEPQKELAVSLARLKIRWLLRKSGRGVRAWCRTETGVPRTIVDNSLEEQIQLITIPDGLIEPEQVHTSKPGSLFGCIFGVLFFLLVLVGVFFLNQQRRFPPFIFWGLTLGLLGNILQLILGLPAIHRRRNLPSLLRRIGRRRGIRRSFVVGPGWIKCGKRVWRADRDLLLIRRTGFRLASSEIDCMLAGPESRLRMTFSGTRDEDFQILFGAWNVEDIRLEFIDSELS